MYLLRRAAVRALSQTSRNFSTIRPTTPRVTVFQSAKPTLHRPFHQTRIWRAEQELKEGEEAEEAAVAVEEAEEEAAVAAEAAEGAQEVAQRKAEEASEVAENASAAAGAASAAAAAATTSSAPRESTLFPNSESSASAGTDFRTAQPSRILYIGNLFFEVTPAQLEAEFAQFGRITNSRIVTDARGLSKGFGYIEFDKQDEADRAVKELDQKVFQGRRMAVQYHVRRETRRGVGQRDPNPPSKTLFIGNMSYQMSDRDLNDLFREIRDVLDVRVAIDRRSGQPRGFAHADFVDVQSAQRAKEHLEKKVVYGRQLRVDYSQSSSQTQQA